MHLNFHLPLFDVLPSANTAFMEGDILYGGCREVSFRDILVDDEEQYKLLQRSIDDQHKLNSTVQIRCIRRNANSGSEENHLVTMCPQHFRFLGHRSGKDAELQHFQMELHEPVPALARNKWLVFEVDPKQMVLSNFPGVEFGNCRLDYDFIKVENLEGGPLELWRAPVNRYSLRANILGIARLREVNKYDSMGLSLEEKEKHYVYDVDWFPKRSSIVENGNLLFLPRLPSEEPAGVSRRFWKDVDIKAYAHQFDAPPNPEACVLCGVEARDSDCVLDPCGHQFCHQCLMEHRNQQLPRNVPNSCPMCRDPIRAVIRHPPRR